MSKPTDAGSDPDDLLSLIAEVHADAPAAQDHLDRALKTLESTHRRASAAMQRFERTGRTDPGERPRRPQAPVFGAARPAWSADRLDPNEAMSAGAGAGPEAGPEAELGPASPEGPLDNGLPGATDNAPGPGAEPTHTAVARPPKAIAVAEVLSGRGAEFVDHGHTRTHIIRPRKSPSKK